MERKRRSYHWILTISLAMTGCMNDDSELFHPGHVTENTLFIFECSGSETRAVIPEEDLINDINLIIFENGKADYRKISDIELCTELDTLARNRYGVRSVYGISSTEKQIIAEDLYRNRHLSESQIRRCLAFPKR